MNDFYRLFKGFSFDQATPLSINEDLNDSVTQININDQLPLTTSLEPNYKQIGTTYAICLQISTVVSIGFSQPFQLFIEVE